MRELQETRVRGRRSTIAIYAGVGGAYIIGFASIFSMPVFVGPIMDAFAITERDIGLIAGLELTAMAISSVWFATRIQGQSLFAVASAGLALALLGHSISIVTESAWVFAGCRFVAGLGEGSALAAGNATGAAQDNPERVFAVVGIFISVVTIFMVGSFPHVIELWGYRAGIGALVAVLLIVGLLTRGLPRQLKSQIPDADGSTEAHFPFKVAGILILLAYSLVSLVDIGLWVFTERIGINVGLSPERIGLLLAVTTAIGLLGPLMAAVLHVRFGRILPFTVGLLVFAASCIGIGNAWNATIYMIALLPLNWAVLFLAPYFMGALADLDPRGSWITLSGAVGSFSRALGPPIMGWLALVLGYATVSTILGLCVLLALALMLVVFRYQSRVHGS